MMSDSKDARVGVRGRGGRPRGAERRTEEEEKKRGGGMGRKRRIGKEGEKRGKVEERR